MTGDNPKKIELKQGYNASALGVLTPAHAALSQALAGTGNYVVFGDTDHADKRLLEFLANPHTMAILKAHQFEMLSLELRHEFQPLISQVVRGKMSPEVFAQRHADTWFTEGSEPHANPTSRGLLLGQIARLAGQQGISILAAERQEKSIAEHDRAVSRFSNMVDKYLGIGLLKSDKDKPAAHLVSLMGYRMQQSIYEWTGGRLFSDTPQDSVILFQRPLLNRLYEQDSRAIPIAQEWKQAVEQRLRGDKPLADYIREQAAGRKTGVFYGVAHGSVDCDLNEHLGNAKRIHLFAYTDHMKKMIQGSFIDRNQLPESAITLDTGKLYNRDELEKLIVRNTLQIPYQFVPTACAPN